MYVEKKCNIDLWLVLCKGRFSSIAYILCTPLQTLGSTYLTHQNLFLPFLLFFLSINYSYRSLPLYTISIFHHHSLRPRRTKGGLSGLSVEPGEVRNTWVIPFPVPLPSHILQLNLIASAAGHHSFILILIHTHPHSYTPIIHLYTINCYSSTLSIVQTYDQLQLTEISWYDLVFSKLCYRFCLFVRSFIIQSWAIPSTIWT